MIYITGDVHSEEMGGWEQETGGQELAAAEQYLQILSRKKLSCTLFVNGICLDKNPEKIKKLLEYDVELGGHTYNNFGKMNIFKSFIFRKYFGAVYGPKFYQRRDILKTKRAFEKMNLKINSWRTHAFASNNTTFKLLSENGVKFVSDFIGNTKPFFDKVWHIPINIPVDQNTVAYGNLCPENRDPFASCTRGRIMPEEWFEIVKKRIEANERKGIDSVLLIHPETMKVLDNFKIFQDIVKFLSKYKTGKICEFKLA